MTEAWHDGSGNPVHFKDIMSHVEYYIENGGRVFVGTDSQLKPSSCLYVTSICLHGERGSPPGIYFFKKYRETKKTNKVLRNRILQEVQYSIDIAMYMVSLCPEVGIEIHIDVGNTHRSATRIFADYIRGWIKGVGFECKLKPDAWASSSVADWHTKR